MNRYEEQRDISVRASWVALIVFAALLWCWMMFVRFAVPDAPRQWDFGVLPDTPAESIYSTSRPAHPDTPAAQILPLPEAEPIEEAAP